MALEGMETDLGEYQLLDRIAAGGMAMVFLASTQNPAAHGDADRVVIKRLLPQFRGEPEFVKLFMDEAKLCVKLRHKHVVRTYRAFKRNLDFYMVQEYIDGGSLMQIQKRLRRRELRMPIPATIAVMVGLLKAIDYVHRARQGDQHVRLVHRDVNPGNIILGRNGVVKLTDFGVAEGEGVGANKSEGALRGTPAYMAPEQVRGKMVDPRTDLFSVGIVMWELLTGRELFAADSEFETLRRVNEHQAAPPSIYAAKVPSAIDDIVVKALMKDPDQRWQSASKFGKALLKASKAEGWGNGDVTSLATAVTHALE